MQKRTLSSLTPLGFHTVAYLEWGDAVEQTIVCLHGLTRNSRDFDFLAQKLCTRARVVCPDLPGRGDSTWFPNPVYYSQPQYMADLVNLIARLNVNKLTWIGTSLGGVLGMFLAAQNNTPIKALVLNDVGPLIPHVGIARINKYAKQDVEFSTLEDAEKYLRSLYPNCEPLTEELWQYKTLHSVIKLPTGKYTLAYDPKIVHGYHKLWFSDINLWPLWSQIRCPVLVLRGEKSDILLKNTTEQMRATGPNVTVHEIPGCGHAPMLMTEDQMSIIYNWLDNLNLLTKSTA